MEFQWYFELQGHTVTPKSLNEIQVDGYTLTFADRQFNTPYRALPWLPCNFKALKQTIARANIVVTLCEFRHPYIATWIAEYVV